MGNTACQRPKGVHLGVVGGFLDHFLFLPRLLGGHISRKNLLTLPNHEPAKGDHDNHTNKEQIGKNLNVTLHDRNIVGVVYRDKVGGPHHGLLQILVHRLKQAIQHGQFFFGIVDHRNRSIDLVDLDFQLFDCLSNFRHRKKDLEPVPIAQQVDAADQNFIFQQHLIDRIIGQTNPTECGLDVALNNKKLTLNLENRPNEIFAVLEAFVVKLTDDGGGKNAIKRNKQDQCDKHGPA